MGEQTKNMLIGVFVIAACSLLVSIILFLKPSVGDGKKLLYVRFSNINKINVGTQVTYAGKPCGEVIAVDEIYQARDQPTDSLGRYYFYQLVLKVDSHVVVYNTDEISLQTSGLLGEKSVAIIPKKPPKGVIPKVIANEPIYANSVDPIENTFQQLSELADKLDITVDEINHWIKENGDDIAQAINAFGGAMHQADMTMKEIVKQNLIGAVRNATESFTCLMGSASDALETMHQEGVFTNIGTIANNFKNTSTSIDLVAKDIADGKGSIGRLLKGDDMYLRVTAILSKVDTMMNDINHYGILFNLNKQWQRTRSQRASLLEALSTPNEFKNYFQNEVDQINTAMSRLSMLINKAQQTSETERILESPMFREDFAELLREVDELSENLRLYNEQLMEAQDP